MLTECPRWAPPLLAVQFLTRLPVPVLSRLTEEQAAVGLGRAMAWLPPVGSLIGAITGTTFLLAQCIEAAHGGRDGRALFEGLLAKVGA